VSGRGIFERCRGIGDIARFGAITEQSETLVFDDILYMRAYKSQKFLQVFY